MPQNHQQPELAETNLLSKLQQIKSQPEHFHPGYQIAPRTFSQPHPTQLVPM